MSNVVSLEQTREYLVGRAARHRRAGRYDEAMTLLTRAKAQFGEHEDVEAELARVYDEMGCEEAADRAYLRVVRMGGARCGEAYFQLALSSAQRADLKRAQSYFERFIQVGSTEIPKEATLLLGRQLRDELERPFPTGPKGRARALERRAVERLSAGKTAAAMRTLRHSLALHETAQGYTLLACCHLMAGQSGEAVRCARQAHAMAPSRIQTLCVLADACMAAGDPRGAKRAMALCELRCASPDDLLGAAMESAKSGDDAMTLRLTRRLLGMEPYSTRGMMLRAMALMNLGRCEEAARLLGRLCVLTPEDTVCRAYYRMAREGERPEERLALGLDVTRQEAASRAMTLIAALYAGQSSQWDEEQAEELCRLSAWAFRSPVAGEQTAVIALLVMGAMDTERSRGVLRDALTDPQLPDSFKCAVLTELTAKDGFSHDDVDFDGRLVRLAAGGVSSAEGVQAGQEIVQRASDALTGDYPDAAQAILPLWLAYLEQEGAPKGSRRASACASALELLYHENCGRQVNAQIIAHRNGVSARLCRLYARRIRRAAAQKQRVIQDERKTKTEEHDQETE